MIAWLRRAMPRRWKRSPMDICGGRPPAGEAGAALFVAAALQVYFARLRRFAAGGSFACCRSAGYARSAVLRRSPA